LALELGNGLETIRYNSNEILPLGGQRGIGLEYWR
jgi:hypothetical protein